MRWIPLEEVMKKHMNKAGFAEGCEQARRELEEDIAKYGTIANPKRRRLSLFAKKSRVHPRCRQTVIRPAVEA